MLATELTNSEIVLGKLAARLLPVAALVMATIPVLALSGLLGGVVFEAIVSLTLITLAVAIFGCALALAISVRATKAHEVLMAVYTVEVIWILSPLVALVLVSTNRAPAWLVAINPFVLAWAPLCLAGLCKLGLARGHAGRDHDDLPPDSRAMRCCVSAPKPRVKVHRRPPDWRRGWARHTAGYSGGARPRHSKRIQFCGVSGGAAGRRDWRGLSGGSSSCSRLPAQPMGSR